MSDELKIRKGLKTLTGGNFIQKLFGNANYDKILKSYKKEFIQTRRKTDGTTYLYHTGTKKVITEAEIQDDIELKFTGTKTPFKDAKYLTAKKELAGIDKDITWKNLTFSDIGHMIRRRFSEKQFAGEGMPNEGAFLGTQYDIDRKETLEKKVSNLKKDSSYKNIVDPLIDKKAAEPPAIFSVKDERIDYYDKNNEKVANDLDKEIENLENSIKIVVKMK